MIREVQQICHLNQARILLHPLRIQLLRVLYKPSVCADLAKMFRVTPQRMNHHLKEMLSAHLISVVSEQKKRNTIEKTYRAVAKHYWLSPQITRQVGGHIEELKQKVSLHNLILMAEQLQEDAASLFAEAGDREVPSIGVTAEIQLNSIHEREQFTKDYLQLMEQLLDKYRGRETRGAKEQRYTAMLVCYPTVKRKEKTHV